VNRLAIDDLLGGILSGWYESVADWAPPGQGSGEICLACPDSILAGVLDVQEWPHDLMHQLAMALDDAALQIYEALDEQPIDECDYGSSFACVRRYVADTLTANRADVTDVLAECVTPKLDAYVTNAVNVALARVDS
jgi:hypothetical protein